MVLIRFVLLFFCLIGATHAKAEHLSHLALTDSATSATTVTPAMPAPLFSVLTQQASISSICIANITTAPPKLAPATDLSHDIHVNGFTLRFAQASVNHNELTPEYVKIFEFSVLPRPEASRSYVEPFTPQLNWMMQINSQSSRLSAWKDSNLQYIPQQYSSLFA